MPTLALSEQVLLTDFEHKQALFVYSEVCAKSMSLPGAGLQCGLEV